MSAAAMIDYANRSWTTEDGMASLQVPPEQQQVASSSSLASRESASRSASTMVYPTPLSPAPPPSQSSRKQRASHTIQSASPQTEPVSTVIDVYAHPAAVAYAAAHPRRSIPKFGPYLLLQTLGEGEFGKVKLGLHGQWGEEVAVKLIRRGNVDSSLRMSKVEREIEVLRTINHPNIVRLYDVIETDKYIGIILEYASGGELFDHILAHRYLREKDASKLFAQLISGVSYIHSKKIVHRDLKLENLLLDRNRNVIITDFGFANRFEHRADDLMQTSCGSPCYAAPELVISEGLYVGSAVDIWSCGVILYAMLAGYLPFDDDPANPDGDNINLLYKYIINTPLTFPDYVSAEARDLLSRMLVPDPAKRSDLTGIMSHSWLRNYRHLFERTVEEVERAAAEGQELKRLAYQRQMKAKERDVEMRIGRSQSVRPDPVRAGREYLYETAEPLQVASSSSARRAVASAIVMPSSTPLDDDPFSMAVSRDRDPGGDEHAPDGRSRKESSKSKKSSRSSKAPKDTSSKSPSTPKESRKRGGYRHTIQLEYDDGESPQSPPRPTQTTPSSRSHHHRHQHQEQQTHDAHHAPANGNGQVQIPANDVQRDSAGPRPVNGITTQVDEQSTPRKNARGSSSPPAQPQPTTSTTSRATVSGSRSSISPSSPSSPTSETRGRSSPTSPKAPSSPTRAPVPGSPRSRVASSPPYMRAPATEPTIPTSSRKDDALPALPLAPPTTGESQALVQAEFSRTTSDAPAGITSDASHHSTSSSNKGSRHRKGMSMDKFGLSKLLSGSSREVHPHNKDSSGGSISPPHISGPFAARKTPSGSKTRLASEGATDRKPSDSPTPSSSPSALPQLNSKSSAVGLSEGEKGSVEGDSVKSKRKSGRKTLSLMVEPFGRSLKDRSKVRSATADSGKSSDASAAPVTAPLPASKPPSSHVKAASGHPPATPSSHWKIPLFRDSRLPPSQLDDLPSRVSDLPTVASRGSTTKSQKVMDWFRMKSLAKSNDVEMPISEPPLIDEPVTPTLGTYHVVEGDSSSTLNKMNQTTPALVVTTADWSPHKDTVVGGSQSQHSGYSSTGGSQHVPAAIRVIKAVAGVASVPTPSTSSRNTKEGYNVKAIRVHHGAVDQATVTTGFPPEVFEHVTKVLLGMGVEIQKESEFKYRCVRPKRKKGAMGSKETGSSYGALAAFTMMGSAASNGVDKRGLPIPSYGSFSSGGILKGLLMRRQTSNPNSAPAPLPSPAASLESDSVEPAALSPPSPSLGHDSNAESSAAAAPTPIYGDGSSDQADEVRFSVELTRIDRLEGTFSLDIRRLKGNLRSYKFLYDTLRERCDFH